MVNWLNLYTQKNETEFSHITPHISYCLVYLGVKEIIKIYYNNTIILKYKILLILTLIFSTISDGLFISNGYIPLLDRYLGILTILTILARIKNYQFIFINRYFQIKIIIAFYFIIKSRNSKTFTEWNNNHFMWHIITFDVLDFIIKNGVYSNNLNYEKG